ncbi:hypothetical protein Pelo_10993 [Pelomyxa schiedti]|nr:hypothetical protein Pelo_10993 [Pelomyxa schiedti]
MASPQPTRATTSTPQAPFFVLMGDAGSGKSTLCEKLTGRTLRGVTSESKVYPIERGYWLADTPGLNSTRRRLDHALNVLGAMRFKPVTCLLMVCSIKDRLDGLEQAVSDLVTPFIEEFGDNIAAIVTKNDILPTITPKQIRTTLVELGVERVMVTNKTTTKAELVAFLQTLQGIPPIDVTIAPNNLVSYLNLSPLNLRMRAVYNKYVAHYKKMAETGTQRMNSLQGDDKLDFAFSFKAFIYDLIPKFQAQLSEELGDSEASLLFCGEIKKEFKRQLLEIRGLCKEELYLNSDSPFRRCPYCSKVYIVTKGCEESAACHSRRLAPGCNSPPTTPCEITIAWKDMVPVRPTSGCTTQLEHKKREVEVENYANKTAPKRQASLETDIKLGSDLHTSTKKHTSLISKKDGERHVTSKISIAVRKNTSSSSRRRKHEIAVEAAKPKIDIDTHNMTGIEVNAGAPVAGDKPKLDVSVVDEATRKSTSSSMKPPFSGAKKSRSSSSSSRKKKAAIKVDAGVKVDAGIKVSGDKPKVEPPKKSGGFFGFFGGPKPEAPKVTVGAKGKQSTSSSSRKRKAAHKVDAGIKVGGDKPAIGATVTVDGGVKVDAGATVEAGIKVSYGKTAIGDSLNVERLKIKPASPSSILKFDEDKVGKSSSDPHLKSLDIGTPVTLPQKTVSAPICHIRTDEVEGLCNWMGLQHFDYNTHFKVTRDDRTEELSSSLPTFVAAEIFRARTLSELGYQCKALVIGHYGPDRRFSATTAISDFLRRTCNFTVVEEPSSVTWKGTLDRFLALPVDNLESAKVASIFYFTGTVKQVGNQQNLLLADDSAFSPTDYMMPLSNIVSRIAMESHLIIAIVDAVQSEHVWGQWVPQGAFSYLRGAEQLAREHLPTGYYLVLSMNQGYEVSESKRKFTSCFRDELLSATTGTPFDDIVDRAVTQAPLSPFSDLKKQVPR